MAEVVELLDLLVGPGREEFSHEELKLGGNSIRLITLQPDSNEYNTVTCEITQYALHRRPGYIALSYTWGPVEGQFPIILNGKYFFVRRNLYDCLAQIRKHHHEPVTLWIDALCIDQNNIPERNHIVQLMDQVYERADQVYVWLGIGDDDSNQAMEFFEKVATDMKAQTKNAVDVFHDTYVFPHAHYHNWIAVYRLFHRDYWERLWIVQETLLADNLELFCGTRRIPWQHVQLVLQSLKNAYSHYDKRRPEKSELHGAILHTVAARMFFQRCDSTMFAGKRDKYPSLQTLLETFKDSLCFDARDEIFGLLSIAGDFFNKRIDYIDYNLRPTEIFVKFMQHYSKHSDEFDDDEVMYNIRRLSDALRLNVYSELLVKRRTEEASATSYLDLTSNTHDASLSLPCQVIAKLVAPNEVHNETISCCELKDYSDDSAHGSPLSLVSSLRPLSISCPSSIDETFKLRHLESTKAIYISDAYFRSVGRNTQPSTDSEIPKYKCFTPRSVDAQAQHKQYLGLACSASQPGDLLVQLKKSDLTFVARESEGGIFVVGTAVIHEESNVVQQLTTTVWKWWSGKNSWPDKRPRSPIGNLPRSSFDDSTSLPKASFNPLMLLMIVNEENWLKSNTDASPRKSFSRQASSYNAIQPRGDDDPMLKNYGKRDWLGVAHFDRGANRLVDRTKVGFEEIREKALYYDDD